MATAEELERAVGLVHVAGPVERERTASGRRFLSVIRCLRCDRRVAVDGLATLRLGAPVGEPGDCRPSADA